MSSSSNPHVFIGLGSNVGDRKKNIAEAINLLHTPPDIKVENKSSLYLTEPIGYVGQDPFLNSVVEVSTLLSPDDLLHRCQAIEEQMGRVRTMMWGPRLIDLDILLYGDEIIEDNELIIPHPQMHIRKFVLLPLVEIAPDVLHPKLNKTVSELLRLLEDGHKVEVYKDGTFK